VQYAGLPPRLEPERIEDESADRHGDDAGDDREHDRRRSLGERPFVNRCGSLLERLGGW
jgi:hypothetical protein